MHNLGPVSKKWLAGMGIHTIEDLKKCDLVQTYILLKEQNPKVSLNLLWGMYGAVHNLDWKSIDSDTKHLLKVQVSLSQKKGK